MTIELTNSGTIKEVSLNWVFLVDWILALFAAITIIFHFNRYIGTLISFIGKIYIWKKYKIRIKITSVKVSFLGGRIFFKNLVIITQNETISALQGTLTWRYWLNATMKTDLEAETCGLNKEKNEKLPSRFLLQLYGLEWFMYNRVSAYDNLMAFIDKSDKNNQSTKEDQNAEDVVDEKDGTNATELNSTTETFQLGATAAQETIETPRNYHKDPIPVKFWSFLNLLPMSVEVKKGSIAFGNKTTSSILVATYTQGTGLFDISKSDNPLDLYRYFQKMDFAQPKIIMRPNLSYDHKGDSTEDNANNQTKFKPLKKKDVKAMKHKRLQTFLSVVRSVSSFIRGGRRRNHKGPSVEEEQWHGLRQYLDESESPDMSRPRIVVNHDEYAKYSTLLDAESALISYYYDIPGKIHQSQPLKDINAFLPSDINNDDGPAPVFGAYIAVSHGLVHYGPWAHKERVGLQNMLFPSASRDAEPHTSLEMGDTRKYTGFKLEINVIDDMIFRVPFREFSKNTKVESKEEDNDTATVPEVKPTFGWLELKMQESTSFITQNSFIPTLSKGWDNNVSIEVTSPELRTSINHDIVFKADRHSVRADLGFPLQWNGLTNWKLHNRSQNSEIFVLREHISLFSDLMADLSYGNPTPYELFKPFIYDIDLELTHGYKLYLNANHKNIINNPLDFNDNLFLSFQGDNAFIDLTIPLDTVVRKSTTVSFEITTEDTNLIIDAPPWHTLNNFMESTRVGKAHNFSLAGSYTSYSVIEMDSVDTIVLDCACEDTVLELYGFILRYLLIIKENYFGVNKIFKTLAEYTTDEQLQAPPSNSVDATDTPLSQYHKTANELDLLFSFQLINGCLVLPALAYSCDTCVPLYFDKFDADIRYTNYYMDMQCDVSEVSTRFYKDRSAPFEIDDALTRYKDQLKHQASVETLSVHGHRMFGLPPIEPTYFCEWDFRLGEVIMKGEPEFAGAWLSCLNVLGFSAKDSENLLVSESAVLHDVVVVTFECPKILLTFENEDGGSLEILLTPVKASFNDMANPRYSTRMNAKIPMARVNVRDSGGDVMSSFETSVYFTNFTQKEDFVKNYEAQQEHLALNDAPFHRLPFLIRSGRNTKYRRDFGTIKPSISLPPLAPPVNAQSIDMIFEEYFTEEDNESFQFDWENTKTGTSSSEKPLKMQGSRSYYTDSDFMPVTGPDPKYEYDNFVITFEPIEGFFNPDSLPRIVDIADKLSSVTLDGTMDSIHRNTIKGLRNLVNDTSTVINCRLTIPQVNIKYGHFDQFGSVGDMRSSDTIEEDFILALQGISMAFSEKATRTTTDARALSERVKVLKETSMALHVTRAAFKLFTDGKQSAQKKAMSLNFFDVELWNSEDIVTGLVGSSNCRSFEYEIDSDSLSWVSDFCSSTVEKVKPSFKKLSCILDRQKKASVHLLYAISVASVEHNIQHDPAVLTKPAYIMRSSDSHIRFHDSWKVVIRLRHILKNVPPAWKANTNKAFSQNIFTTKEDPCAAVLKIFKNWRSWEFTDISRCFLFRKTFGLKSPSAAIMDINSTKMINVALENGAIVIKSAESGPDYIDVDFFNGSAMFTKLETSDKYEAAGLSAFSGNEIKVVLNLVQAKTRITPVSTNVVHFAMDLKQKLNITKPETQLAEGPPAPKLAVDISIVVNDIENQILIDKTGMSPCGKEFAFSMIGVAESGLTGNIPLSVVTTVDEFYCDVSMDGSPAGSITGKKGCSILSNAGTLVEGLKKLNIGWEEIGLQCDQGTDQVILLFDTFTNHDLKTLQKIISKLRKEKRETPKEKSSESTANFTQFYTCPILFSTDIAKFTFELELLSPVKYRGSVISFKTDTHITKDVLISSLKVGGIHTQLVSRRHTGSARMIALKTDLVNIELISKLVLANDYNLLHLLGVSDRAVLKIPHLADTLEAAHAHQDIVKENLKKIHELTTRLRNVFQHSHEEDVVKQKNVSNKPLLVKVSAKSKYAAVITKVEDCVYRLDTKATTIAGLNYLVISESEIIPVRPHGEISLPTSRIVTNVKNEDIVVFGWDMAIQVANPVEKSHKLQTLQVEVHYSHLFMTPTILLQVLTFHKVVSALLAKFKINRVKSTEAEASVALESKSVFGFHSIHVLAYNLCAGWIFDDLQHGDGIIIGAERIFMVFEAKVGKLTLVDAYMALARGSTYSTFTNGEGEYASENRAFLPNMQFIYAIVEKEGRKNILSTVSGEQLDVRFKADGDNILEGFLRSMNYSKHLMDQKKLFDDAKKPQTKTSAFDSVSIGKVGIHSVECIVKLAGAKIIVYNHDADTIEACSSFTLEAPAIKIATQYLHSRDSVKKHNFQVEVISSASQNTLYATCVPVLSNLYGGIRKMMKVSESTETSSDKTPSSRPPSSPTFIENVSLSFGLKIEPQEIALSCEPTAKVKAAASFGGLQVRAGTSGQDVVWATIRIEHLKASLQHVYSRETSGSFEVSEVLLYSSYSLKDSKKLAASSFISEVNSFVNVKQLQDLDLFKDIWVPKEFYEEMNRTSEQNEEGPKNTSSSVAKARMTSTTTPLPWILQAAISKINCTVDMGKSLGTLNFTVSGLWAISKRSIQWEQSMKLLIDSVNLTSEGRLGGQILLSRISLSTAISWTVSNKTYEHPLVVISATIESAQAKSSLDFHTFFVGKIIGASVNIVNKRGQQKSAHDTLLAMAEVQEARFYLTALAASNFWDIFNIALRIRKDIQISYREVLKDSSAKASNAMLKKKDESDSELANIIGGLATSLDVQIRNVQIQIYPSSFVDTQVVAMKLGEAHAKFYQNTAEETEDRLNFQLNNFSVALSTLTNEVGDENKLSDLTISEIFENSKEARRGTIFVFPAMYIDMNIWQALDSDVIKYEYKSSFAGKVEIRWNLGSVNFIRDMWMSHANALSSRLESYRRIQAKNGLELGAQTGDKSLFETANLEDKLKDVETGSKFEYVALAPLVAEAPQLKELGEATPPLEWFGLHRDKFPNMTHQFIIISLQKMVHEVEIQYGKILK